MNTNNLQTSAVSMSSLEIAELTGKEHRNVTRDIENMLKDLDVSVLKFEHTYKDSQNKDQKSFNLDKEHSLILVSGYSVKLRAAIVKRWIELERVVEVKPVTQAVVDAQVAMVFLNAARDQLNFSDASYLGLMQKTADLNGISHLLALPNYVDQPEGVTVSATDLLKKYEVGIGVVKFNKILIAQGYLEEKSRRSTTVPSGKLFKSLINDGLEFGKNIVSPKNERETTPHYFEHKFEELIMRLDLTL